MTQKLKARGDWEQFVPVLRNLEPFTTHGALYGTARGASEWELRGYSQLPPYLWKAAMAADYTVWSYHTPIAWHTPHKAEGHQGCWTIPDLKYSTTTTNHQREIMTVLLAMRD